MIRNTLCAAAITLAALAAQTTTASAIDVVNCTKDKIKILIFNQNDKFETVNKGVITLRPKKSINGLDIQGKNYHKFKIFKRGLVDGHLGTFRGIDENKRYWLYYTGGKTINIKTRPNNGSCRT